MFDLHTCQAVKLLMSLTLNLFVAYGMTGLDHGVHFSHRLPECCCDHFCRWSFCRNGLQLICKVWSHIAAVEQVSATKVIQADSPHQHFPSWLDPFRSEPSGSLARFHQRKSLQGCFQYPLIHHWVHHQLGVGTCQWRHRTVQCAYAGCRSISGSQQSRPIPSVRAHCPAMKLIGRPAGGSGRNKQNNQNDWPWFQLALF